MPKKKVRTNNLVVSMKNNTGEMQKQQDTPDVYPEQEQENDKQEEAIPEVRATESLRVQKAEWVRQQLEQQHRNDAAAWDRLVEEQKLLSERNLSIDNDISRNRHMQRYHDECVEDLKSQVYALHGISEDKLQGIQEYKKAQYQGCAAVIFFLSVAITLASGYFVGITSEMTLFMLACLGIEGTLLSQEGKRGKFLDAVCRLFYLIPLPAMLTVFLCYMMEIPIYEQVISWGAIVGVCMAVIGTVSYFVHNPYREESKNIREARADLKEVEQSAKKTVKKNQKIRQQEEKRLANQMERNNQKAVKQEQNHQKKMLREQKRREKKENRRKKWENVKQNWQQKRETYRLEKAKQKAENASAQVQQLQAGMTTTESVETESAAIEKTAIEKVATEKAVTEKAAIQTTVTEAAGTQVQTDVQDVSANIISIAPKNCGQDSVSELEG